MSKRFLPIACCLLSALAACKSAEPFDGLAPAQQTGGPRVVFDLTRKPFAEVPFPNDILTRVDSSSLTGVRLNTSLVAPTQIERDVHGRLDSLDGFGTFAPLTVAFDADLDVPDLLAAQLDPNPANHAVYLVEIATGNQVPLDFGVGPHSHFPYTLPNPVPYFVNDPFADETNLLFPTRGPFANLLHPLDPSFPALHGNVAQQDEDVLEFYERSTHTLILRPVVPLRQQTRYAVILTDRLRGTQQRAIVAPGSGINHPGQTNELRPLLAHLPPGVQLSNVAYAWAFTTQSVTPELEAIAQGLNGTGGLLILSTQYPIQVSAPEVGPNLYRTLMVLSRERDAGDDQRPDSLNSVYRITPADLLPFLSDPAVAPLFGSPGPKQVQALAASFRYVDYFVSGAYTSPSFLEAGDQLPEDTSFRVDLNARTARVIGRLVPFFIAVPKRTTLHKPPFPSVIVGHGFGSSRAIDMLAFAGTFAKFGLASVSIDAFGHGIGVNPATAAAIHAAGASRGIGAFADAILKGRARDLDHDGIVDPGGDFFGAQLFHTRDVLRQTTVDWLQLAKLIHSFDGTGAFLFAPNPGGTPFYSFAGDFNGDAIPDLGGLATFPGPVPPPPNVTVYPAGAVNPGSDIFTFGESLGGILTGTMPALDPSVRGAVAVSGGGGLTDIALRTNLAPIVNAVLLPMFGPFVATCPYSAALGRCAPGEPDAQPTLVMVVADLTRERDLPVARLALQPGDKVSVRDLKQLPATALCSGDALQGCATGTADASGNVRVAFSADWPTLSVTQAVPGGAPATVTVLTPGDPLQIEIQSGSTTRTINSFGFDTTFYGVTYRAGDPLSAPARGYGRTRNTPEFRRLVQIAQTVLEPADPINYAPYYFQQKLAARAGAPIAPTLVVGTVGDPAVPVSTAISLARAAGMVEMTQPDPAYRIPIDQVLIESGVVEGVARTQRFASTTFGPRATLGSHVRCDAGADCTGDVLVDPSGYSCDEAGASCTDGLNAPRLNPPLREQLLRPVKLADGSTGFSGLLLPYLTRTGQHGFSSPQPQKLFDMDRFLANLIGRYFETKGREVHFDACQAVEPVDPATECPWMAPPPGP